MDKQLSASHLSPAAWEFAVVFLQGRFQIPLFPTKEPGHFCVKSLLLLGLGKTALSIHPSTA